MTTAQEMLKLLKTFNRGVKDVTISNGVVTVLVTSKKAALGVATDLQRCRAFRSITAELNEKGDGILIHATPGTPAR